MNRIFCRLAAPVFAICLTFLSLSVSAAPKPPVMQLGDAIKPLAYDAALTIVPASDKFEGQIAIDIEILESRDFYWLNATGLDIRRATLTTGAQTLAATVIPGGEDFIGVQFRDKAALGKGRLTIAYTGNFIRNDTRGLFKQQENADWYVFSQFESHSARRAFPSFDEPQWRTPWTLTLTVKRDHVAVSNMQAVSEENIGTDMKRVRFAPTLPLPSYLVALGVGPFDVLDGGTAGKNRIPLRYITPKGRASEAAYAARVTPALLESLEDYFGRPYPFSKLDSMVIPVTVNFGAMENAGLITYRGNIMLARPSREDDRFQQRYASTGAHEMAHQWFGNLVTMRWWTDIWLNESFATWMARKTVEKFNPAWDAEQTRTHERHKAMQTDRLASTRQVRQEIRTPDDLANAFDSITYDKGGAVLRMFESWLGEERFRDGVRRYLNRHAFGNATAEDFFAALSQTEPALAKGFSSFVEQPGMPLVRMTLDCRARPTLHLQQQRFLPGGDGEKARQQTWNAPVCVRYQGQASDQPFCTFLSDRQASVVLPEATACPAWLLPNPAGVGYYLSTVAPELLAHLKQAPLTSPEVVALLSDLSALANSGAFPLDQVMELAAAYAGDPRPEVVKAAVDAVSGKISQDALIGMHPAAFAAAPGKLTAAWVTRHFGRRAAELGWLTRDSDTDTTRNLRSVLLPLVAGTGGDPALRAQARDLAMRWLSRDDKVQSGAMLRSILQTAAYSGDRMLFEAMVNAAAKSRDSGERHEIFLALGSFSDADLRQRAFDQVLSGTFDVREAQAIFQIAAERTGSAPALLQYLQSHYDALLAKLPQDSRATVAKWGRELCSAPDRSSFSEFFRERAARHPGGARNLAQALESIDICVANRKIQELGVSRWLFAQKDMLLTN